MKPENVLFLFVVLLLMLNAGETAAQEKTNTVEVLDNAQFSVLFKSLLTSMEQRPKNYRRNIN